MATENVSPEEIAQFYRENHETLLSFAYRLTRDRDIAKDLVSKVYLRFIKGIPKKPNRNLKSYAFTSIQNCFIDKKRKLYEQTIPFSSFTEKGLESIANSQQNPLSILEEKQEKVEREKQHKIIREPISRMTPLQSEAFYYRIAEGLTIYEISKITGRTHCSIKLSTHRAYNCLRTTLASHGIEWKTRAPQIYG